MARRVQWFDSLLTDAFTLVGAAAPGTLTNDIILSAGELDGAGGKVTLTRIVGEIWLRATVGNPSFTAVIHFESDQHAVETDWTAASIEDRPDVVWTGTWRGQASTSVAPTKIAIDVRAKRIMQRGALLLSMQNHSIAGNDLQYIYHTRSLVMLP